MIKKVLTLALIIISTLQLLSQGLNDVFTPIPALVYAVGSNGLTLKSRNAGSSYTSTYVGNSNLNSVFGISGFVWSAGDNGSFNKSIDSGSTWNSINIGTNANLKSIFFIDSLTGFIAGENGQIFKSNDGGNNWINLISGTSNNFNKIKFINQNTGFACGTNGTFVKTINGGLNWNVMSLPTVSDINAFDVLGNVIFAGTSEGKLLRSGDLGSTWSIINLKIRTNPGITSVSMSSETLFYFSLESGSIWYSNDGGSSFLFSRSPLLDEVSSISFLIPRGFAAAKNHAVILRSMDLGLNWNFPANTTYSINFETVLEPGGLSFNKILDINYQKRGTLYACQQNKLFRSMDFGENWSQISTLPFRNACQQLMVSMKDSSKILVVMNTYSGSSGTVYRTTNYGSNWDSVYSGSCDVIGNLITQDPNHPDTVYLGIRDSVIKSTNFGATWAKIAGYSFLDWCDIAVHPSNSNILYGSTNHYPAKLSKSSDGGLTWFTADIVFDTTYSEMPAIATTNLNPNIIFHAQLAGYSTQTGLKRSYSQGNTWLFDVIPGTSWAIDIAKDDPNVFAYGNVSTSTPVYLSINGGINYITSSQNEYAEQILFYDKSNLFTTEGSEIYKMRVTYSMPIGIRPISTEVPKDFKLYQNYPNPFNPSTKIKFEISKQAQAKLITYDILGREVELLINET
ncbi:MAG TPA: YCF48-related protein, partial [Ignavibacteria bacterium]